MIEILKKYIQDDVSNLSKYKYLNIIHSPYFINGPGLGDQTFQLSIYLNIANELNLTLILPKRNLHEVHNSRKTIKLNWHEYYDLNQCLISHVKYVGNKDKHLVLDMLPLSNANGRNGLASMVKYFKENKIPYTNIVYLKKYIEFAKDFVKKQNIDGTIHIRRGDRVNSGFKTISANDYDKMTQADNVLKVLKNKNAPKNIYVMTDMVKGDPVIDDMIKDERYNFSFYYDFPFFEKVKHENNYKLFAYEVNIRKHSEFKIHKLEFIKLK